MKVIFKQVFLESDNALIVSSEFKPARSSLLA